MTNSNSDKKEKKIKQLSLGMNKPLWMPGAALTE